MGPSGDIVLRDRMRALTFDVICRAVFGVTERDRVERLRAALAAVIDTGAMFFLPGALRRDFGPWSPWGRFRAGSRRGRASSTRRSPGGVRSRTSRSAPTCSRFCCAPATRTAAR